jgi:hypothetical protein
MLFSALRKHTWHVASHVKSIFQQITPQDKVLATVVVPPIMLSFRQLYLQKKMNDICDAYDGPSPFGAFVIDKAVNFNVKHPSLTMDRLTDKITDNEKGYMYETMVSKCILSKRLGLLENAINSVWDLHFFDCDQYDLSFAADAIKKYATMYTPNAAKVLTSNNELRLFIANDSEVCKKLNDHFNELASDNSDANDTAYFMSPKYGVNWCDFSTKRDATILDRIRFEIDRLLD